MVLVNLEVNCNLKVVSNGVNFQVSINFGNGVTSLFNIVDATYVISTLYTVVGTYTLNVNVLNENLTLNPEIRSKKIL